MKGSSRPCTATPPLQTQARQEPRLSSVVSWELLPNERGLSSIAEYRSLDLSPGKQRSRQCESGETGLTWEVAPMSQCLWSPPTDSGRMTRKRSFRAHSWTGAHEHEPSSLPNSCVTLAHAGRQVLCATLPVRRQERDFQSASDLRLCRNTSLRSMLVELQR